MKLRPLVAEPGGGAAYPASSASLAFAGAPAGAAAQGFHEVGQSATHAVKSFDDAEQVKRNIQVRNDAHETKAALMVEIEGLQSDLQSTETDPDAYLKKYREGIAKIQATIPGRAKHPQTLELLKGDLALLFGRDEVQARAHSNKLFQGAESAKVSRTLDMYRGLAQGTPLENTARWKELYQDTLKTINDATWLGPEKQQALRVKARHDFMADRALAHAAADPQGFLDDMDKGVYGELDAARADMLVRRATNKLDSDAKARVAADEAFQKQVKEDIEREAGEWEKNITDALAAGDTAMATKLLSDGRDLFEPKRYEHFRDKIQATPLRVRDDPDAERELNSTVYVETVPISVAESTLNRLAKKITPATERTFRNHLEQRRTRAESKAQRAEDKRTAELVREQAQVEQELRLLIPPTGQFGETKTENAQILSDAYSEMSRHNPANGGSVPPREWFDKHKARFVARSTEARGIRLSELKKAVRPYMTGDMPDPARLIRDRANLLQKDPSGRTYYEHMLRLREIDALNMEIERLKGPSGETPSAPSAPKPASGTNLGRTVK